MRKIKLTQGKYALVDDTDFKLVSQYKWYAHKERDTWYACCDISYKPKKCLRMHRLILGLDFGDKRQGDHANHNGLNNQRNNLRICTPQQNHFNHRKKPKGYGFYKNGWMAYIGFNGKLIYLGRFKTEREAKQARREAELIYFGRFGNGYKIQRTGT